jgi:TPR repeat protein
MKIRYLYPLIIVVLFACETDSKKTESTGYTVKGDTITVTDNKLFQKSLPVLIRDVIDTGNPIEYGVVSSTDGCLDGIGFLTSLIMANKYHYYLGGAVIYSYYMPGGFNDSIWNSLDTMSRERTLIYLQLAAENGLDFCQRQLGELYLKGKILPKDIEKGNYWIKHSKDAQNIHLMVRYWINKNENGQMVYDMQY